MLPNPLAADLDHILAHTEGLWEDLRGQRIFLTGGTSFVGCWLLESFAWANDQLQLGAEIHVLSRNPTAFTRRAPHLAQHPSVHLHNGDVRTCKFPSGPFSHFIHGAAGERGRKLEQENALLIFDTLITGTRRVLDFAATNTAPKFLLVSSGEVYGNQPQELTHIPEDFTGAPDLTATGSSYGEGKRAAELLGAIYQRQFGVQTKIARCFVFVGPYLPLNAHFAIGNFIRDVLAGDPICVSGDGTPHRSYLYAADMAIWLWTILLRGQIGRSYNVGSEDSLSIRQLAEGIPAWLRTEARVQIARTPQAGLPPQRYVCQTTRAQRELQLQTLISLPEAVRRTAAWNRLADTVGN